MEKVCKNCSKLFEASGKKIFCCRKCQKKYNRRKNVNPDIMRKGNRFTTDKAFSDRVELFTSKFEFIASGDDFLTIMCKDCGFVFNRSKCGFKPSHRHLIECPNCNRFLSEAIKFERNESKKIENDKKQSDKEIKFWSQQFEQIEIVNCKNCGMLIIGKKFCSDICCKRYHTNNSRKEATRRIRVKSQMVDRDITLRKVYEKDNGICYLCNTHTNFNDAKWKDGAFIVGPTYPTVEHVVPLSKGGLHSWNNVRCACFKCNTLKGANSWTKTS